MRRKPERVRWRARALADLRGFHERLAGLERGNPKKTIARIRAAAENLKRLGDIGRPSVEAGVRELPVRNVPYVIVYQINGDTAEIVAVYHMAQKR